MLELDNIELTFGQKRVLNGLSFVFPANGLFVITGPNGSGKSTLLSVLSGREQKYTGSMAVDGVSLNKDNVNDYSDRMVTFVPQESLVFEDETVLNNVLIPFTKKDKAKARALLKEVGLEELQNQTAENLSAGEKERLAFARAMYDLKPIVLLDEITANLDKESVQVILDCILSVSKNHLVLFVSHETLDDSFSSKAEILSLCDGKLISMNPRPYDDNRFSGKEIHKTGWKEETLDSFHEEKKNHFVVSILAFVFTFVSVFLFSWGFSFYQKYDDKGHVVVNYQEEKVKSVFAESTPFFLSQEKDGFRNPLLKEVFDGKSVSFMHDIDSVVEPGEMFSGFFEVPSEDSPYYSQIHLLQGRMPQENFEGIISDVCLEKLNDQEFSLGQTYSVEGIEMKIVGIYEAKEKEELALRYQNVHFSDLFSSSIRACYAFMIETVFLKASGVGLVDMYAYPNDAYNRSVFLKQDYSFRHLNTDPIILDKDGTTKTYDSMVFGWTSNLVFGLVGAGGLLIFLIVFDLAFDSKQKRRYLLLRLLGARRERMTKSKVFSYSIAATVGYLIGLGLSVLGLVLFDVIGRSKMIGPVPEMISISWFPIVLNLVIVVLGMFVFGLLVYFHLCPKDLSKRLEEVKIK